MMRLRPGALAMLLLALAGCSSLETAKLKDVWWAPTPVAYQKIALVPMSSGEQERKVVDAVFTQTFVKAGVQVIPGEKFIEGARNADGNATMQAIKASGADAVLYVWLRRDDPRVLPGTTDVQPSLGTWNWFGSDPGWYASPQLQRLMIGRFEARLYDMKAQKLVWRASTETFYPKTVDKDAPGVAEAIVNDLAKLGFTPRKP